MISRRINSAYKKNDVDIPQPNITAANETDTNADTCCLGQNFVIISYTSRIADVYPYDTSYKPVQNIPIVSGATAWTNVDDCITYILVINEALYYGNKLDHSLINPNQIRANAIDVHDNPFGNEPISIHIDGGPSIPLISNGTKIYFDSRTPTEEELNICEHIQLTSVNEWNPESVILGKIKSKVIERKVQTVNTFMDPINPYSYAKEAKYYCNDYRSNDMILLDIDANCVMLKERLIEKVTTGKYADHDNTNEMTARRSYTSKGRHNKITSTQLAENWCIGFRRAEATIEATTQNLTRSAILPISRRYRADRNYNIKRLNSKFSTDTIYGELKSLLQNVAAQVYTTKFGFASVYPITGFDGTTIGNTLKDFISDYGVPEHLTFDGALVQTGRNTDFMKTIKKYEIKHHTSSPRRPNENPAEGSIREIKRRWYHIMMKKRVPRRMWDFGLVWVCDTGNLSVSSSKYANGRTAIEIVTGETPDISEYLDFSFYDWVIYRTNAGLGESSLGRWIGVSHKVGQQMSYWILTISGHVISCVTVQRLTEDEKHTDEWRGLIVDYDERIKERLDIKNPETTNPEEICEFNRLSMDGYDKEFIDDVNRVISDDTIPEQDNRINTDVLDGYVNMEIALPRSEEGKLEDAIVKKRAVDRGGIPIGVANSNPMLDSRIYEVEYSDGSLEAFTANIIAENILSQVDEQGHRQLMMDEIMDHRKTSDAIKKDDSLYIPHKTKTTKGWEICVFWKDTSFTWVAMKDIKHAYPTELALYAKANGISEEPAFIWWVNKVIKKKHQIISKIKSKYWQRSYKYGIRIPKTVKEALEIDKNNNDKLWENSIAEEMPKIRNATRIFNGDPKSLIGYQQITGHIIFDIKLGENFRRKARYVADGHKTETPSHITYSSVVSRDSVRIILLIAALNELDILCGDIENAYLTAPCKEKVYTIAGSEFGPLRGKILIIEKALYGLKSSGAAFRSFMAEKLDSMNFKSSMADPDVWMRAAIKPDGEKYYEYILVYVDDILSVSYDPIEPMKEIQRDLKFKKDKIAPPEFYLGGKLEKKELNGKSMWSLTSKDYIKAAVENVEKTLEKKGMILPTRADTPMIKDYYPELDESPELNEQDITWFQELIGILRWSVEIGRVDILTELSLLSAYQASPREGHLNQLLRIFAFLKKKPKLSLYFDPTLPKIDESMFAGASNVDQFKDQYRDAEEEIPDHMPHSRGRPVQIFTFVDASHASNRLTRRSHTGFIIFINRAPILWYSKRQNTVESSTFSSEFIAMKNCMEHIVGLRYKLRMFGIPIEGPAHVLCDNQAVVNNSSKLESVLNKKHCAIAYHAVRWAVTASILRVGKIDTKENLADAMTKRLAKITRDYLFGNWTY